MRAACLASDPGGNPGAALGAAIGRLALEGRDKLTIFASPSIAGFGLWVEQLVAESLGKEGPGVVPVAGESPLGPDAYGDDRLFVHLRLEGEDNSIVDAALDELSRSGQPVVRLDLTDMFDLAAEVFRWEFAVAVAGAVLSVNPFDQPDVQAAKDMTNSVLAEFGSSRALPKAPETMPAADLLSQIRPGDYVAIMAVRTPDSRAGRRSRRSATGTYGPLPSGDDNGVRPPVPTLDRDSFTREGRLRGCSCSSSRTLATTSRFRGQQYSFGVLASAQALGDLRALQAAGRRVCQNGPGRRVRCRGQRPCS